jgi:GTP-binding protein
VIYQENLGRAVEFVTMRKGEMLSMETKRAYDCKIPSHWNYWFKKSIATATAGEAIMAHRFIGYDLTR